jgi:CelD/BcsL family acetyltransferase involved in cellulose biosynthesis
MAQFTMQCLTTYEEFCEIKSEWDEFTSRCFPSNYSRTYPWLAAWWKTYHNLNSVNIYIQRNKEGKINSAAPLYSKWEFFGGLPVRMLYILGNGFGTDDFLVANDTRGFVSAVFKEICDKNWHVVRLGRITNELLLNELLESAKESGCNYTITDTVDFFIRLPISYYEYLQSRTRKFRRNLNQAENRLNKLGHVEFEVLDPYKDAVRVQDAGEEIARTSWQYKEGRSHFNKRNGGTLYSSLAQFERGAGGEDFNLLLVDGKPVAYLLGCRRDRNYYAIDTAFHENFRNVSAGRILFVRIIERLINEQQVDILDFEGAGDYKDDYANEKAQIKSVTLYNNSFYASIIHNFRDSRLYAYLKRRISNTPVPVNGDETHSNIQE